MDNVVIYARFSSSKQQEQSIDGQLRCCREFAERNNMKVVGEYCDRAISGTTDQRPQFQKMISDSASKKFKYVIVWKLDRFTRDRYAAALYKYKLKKNGVKVISATENIGTGNESVILEAVLEAMAELYVTQLAENTRRGSREAVLQGRSAGGVIPYGYDSVDKRLVINPKEAQIVRRIFELYAGGARVKEICDELNGKGYLTRTGRPFSSQSFHTMFANEKYIGVFRYDDIVIEGGCPAIVDREVFEKCRQRQKSNKREAAGRTAKIDYLLKGKVFCGYCGASLVGDSGTGQNGTRYAYYSCATRKKGKECCKQREDKGYIEWYVVEQTVQYVLQPERLDYIADNVVSLYYDGVNELDELKSRKAELEREYDRLVDSLIGAKTQRTIDKINRRAEELDVLLNDLDAEIAELTMVQKAALTKEEVKAWLGRFCDGDPLDIDFQRRVIDTLVNSVYVYDDKFVIYFNVRDGKQISYSQMLDESADIFDEMDGSMDPDDATSSVSFSETICNGSPFTTIFEPYYIFVDGYFGIVVKRTSR